MPDFNSYIHMTNPALLDLVTKKEDATDLELELAQRFTTALETIEGYDAEAARALQGNGSAPAETAT